MRARAVAVWSILKLYLAYPICIFFIYIYRESKSEWWVANYEYVIEYTFRKT